LEVRGAECGDIESIVLIQAACPEVAQWARSDYERVVRGEMTGWVADQGNEIVGFLVARRVVSDVEILNLGVTPLFRRGGVATALLRKALEWARGFGAERAILEVRASNLAALKLYELHDFRATARRLRYYNTPVEDALLLTARL